MSDLHSFDSMPAVLLGGGLSLLVAGSCVFLVRSGRTKASIWELLGISLPIVLILWATLFRDAEVPAFSPGSALDWSGNGWSRISYTPWSSQVVLNAFLFVPAGFAWTLVMRRPFVVTLGLGGLSLLIELAQGVMGLGAPDVADVIANSIGAGLGAAAGWAVPSLAALQRGARPRPRALLIGVAGFAVAATVLFASLTIGADRRQTRLEDELVHLYGASSFEQFERWLEADRLTENVFDRTSVFSDGARYGERSVTIRYPASFFGIRRCVFATWTSHSFEVTRGHGHACTEFFG